MMRLDPFYLLVDDCSWIQRLAPLGLKLVQLRIKDADDEHLRSQIAEAQHICGRFGVQLIINDHWQLAIELGCDFVHLGQEDLDEANLESIRKAGLRLGVSTHDAQELHRVVGLNPDYVALGPIFPTRSKVVHFAAQGLDPIRFWKAQLNGIPLVAIGGLSLEHASQVLEAGADSIAVISDVCQHPDPRSRCKQWLEATRPSNITAAMETL